MAPNNRYTRGEGNLLNPPADHEPSVVSAMNATAKTDPTERFRPRIRLDADLLYLEEDGTMYYDCPECNTRQLQDDARVDEDNNWSCRSCIVSFWRRGAADHLYHAVADLRRELAMWVDRFAKDDSVSKKRAEIIMGEADAALALADGQNEAAQ